MSSDGVPVWRRVPTFRTGQDLSWDPDAGCWVFSGDDPVFELHGQRPWPGWNMMELEIEGDIMHGVASFVLETRHGRYVFDLPLYTGSVTKRLVSVPFGVRRITMVPLDAGSSLRIVHFHWVWLTPWFAHDRLARKLANIHPLYQGLSVRQVMRVLHRESVARGCRWGHVAVGELDYTFTKVCARQGYHQWVELVEPGLKQARSQVSHAAGMVFQQPLLSVLLPLEAKPLPDDESVEQVLIALMRSVHSLQAQQYRQWELCVVIPPGQSRAVGARLRRQVRGDERIRVITGRSECLAGLSRQAFVGSSGSGVMWLSEGDCLATDALQRIVDAWNRQPEAQLFYADEDLLNQRGDRVRPSFKPGWNPDLLMASPYVGRLALYKRRALWRLEAHGDIGCHDMEQTCALELDYSLMLRFLAWWYQLSRERQAKVVCHLPYMLYHRWQRPASWPLPTAGLREQSAVKMVKALLGSLPGGERARAEPGRLPGSVRVRWPVPDPAPLVSLLVPTRDGVEILRPCVDAILERTDYRHFELLILDNQSACPRTLAYMREVAERDARVRVLRWDHPFNYSAINNFGARQARGEIIGLINNDVEPMEGSWLTEMVSQACRPDIGCVGAKLYYPNDTVQHGGVILGLGGVAGHAHRFFQRDEAGYCGRLKLVQNLSAVTAACLLLRREVFEEVGGLNEPDLAVAYNDVDLCLKVREAGYRNLWTPYAELYHHESISRGADDTPVKRARWLSEQDYMKRTWRKALKQDPAYNPNLTLVYEDFSLR